MPDLFTDPKRFIGRARSQVVMASDAVVQFVGTQQVGEYVINDPTTQQSIFRAKLFGPELPPELPMIVKDAVGNLRDALDQAVYCAAVMIVGGDPKKDRISIRSNRRRGV